jgi:hypothetical protein
MLKEATRRLGTRIEELNRQPRLHVRQRKLLAHFRRDRGLPRLEEIGEAVGVKGEQASMLVRGGEELIVSGDRLARRLRMQPPIDERPYDLGMRCRTDSRAVCPIRQRLSGLSANF